MQELRHGQAQGKYFLVLNRSCADLYDEIAELFANRPYIKVVVDRRRGKSGMAEIPASERPGNREDHDRVKPKAA